MKSRTLKNFNDLLAWNGAGTTPFDVGRSIYKYTDCGPWTAFVVKTPWKDSFGRMRDTRYYEDCRNTEHNGDIVGIEIGSIVEGSEAEATPVRLLFPFKASDLDKAIQSVNDEACALWEEANHE